MTDNGAQQTQEPGLATWLYDADQSPSTQATVESQATPQPNTAPLSMVSIGKTALGLVVVIAIILVCMMMLKRFGPYKRMGGRAIKLISGQSIGSRERVVIVEVEDTWLVLGVTQNNINTLHKLPAQRDSADVQEAKLRPGSNPTFTKAFADNLRQATSRWSRR